MEVEKSIRMFKIAVTTLGSHIGVRPCVQLRVYSPVVEAPSNKLLTTAFEASLESAAVTLQIKRRQQGNRDSY